MPLLQQHDGPASAAGDTSLIIPGGGEALMAPPAAMEAAMCTTHGTLFALGMPAVVPNA